MIIVMTVVIGLYGCGRSDITDLDSSAFGAGQIYTFDIGYEGSEDDSLHTALQEFTENVSSASQGAINIDLYSSEELGGASKMAEQVRAGNLDGAVLSSNTALPYCPQISVLRLPFLFQNYEEVERVLESDAAEEITEGFSESQMIPLSFFGGSLWQVSNQLRPVNTPEDLTGMMLHTTDDELTLTVYEKFGALPAPMESSELASALSKKVFHGAVGSFVDLEKYGLSSLQSYLSVLNIQYDAKVMVFSEKIWEDIPSGVRKILSECAQDAGRNHRQLIMDSENSIREKLSESMEIIVPEVNPFKEISDPIYDQYITQNTWADDLVKHIKKQIKDS